MADEEAPIAPPQPVLHTDNVASFLDLQTEFIKRRDAAIEGRKAQAQPSTSAQYHHGAKNKNNILAITKEEKKSKQELSAQRTQRIRQNEEALRKEEQQRANQKQILEQKAQIYERMAKGERLVYGDGKEAEFLVDFHSKKRELEQEQMLEDRGQGSSAGKDARDREAPRFEAPPLIVHYDHTEDKGRVFGASHIPLPTLDEDAREEKIRELKAMTEETTRKRAARKKQRSEEQAEERRRLNRLRVRMGLEPVPSSDEEEEEEEKEEVIEFETPAEVAVEQIPLPPSSPSASSSATATHPDENLKKKPVPEVKKARYGVREWDRGKVGYMHWIEAQREEREEEFAPPTSYYTEDDGSKRKRRWN